MLRTVLSLEQGLMILFLLCVGRLFEALQVHNDTAVDKSSKVKCLLLDIDERLV